jgi:KaiC/GvpD/RAD55 family RecA-like ATPase
MQRIETRIPGLDEMLDGGLPKGSTTIVVGGCENGVYVSFNETPEILQQYMGQYGWDIETLEKQGKLSVMRLDPSDVLQVIREDYGQVRDTLKALGAKRFVLDPLSTFNSIIKDPFDRKMSLLKFCEWLRKQDCTSLMTVEAERQPASTDGLGFEEYVVDGVIVMYNLQMRNVRQSAIEVLKMRGSRHSRKIVPFVFDNGIRISPEEKLFWQAEK